MQKEEARNLQCKRLHDADAQLRTTEGGSMISFPVELLAAVLDVVDARCRLACMHVCKKFAAAACSDSAWKTFVEANFWRVSPDMPFYALARELQLLRKSRRNQGNVISAALCASTTDDAQQTIHETMNAKFTSFWSSVGVKDSDQTDYVVYLLGGNMSLVDRVTVTFYQADYQANSPTYYSCSVQILIGTVGDCEDDYDKVWSQLAIGTPGAGRGLADNLTGAERQTQEAVDRAHWHYESEFFDVPYDPSPQTFQLPRLVPGTLLKVVLKDKIQRQVAVNGLYYVCLQSLFAHGCTLSEVSATMRAVAFESLNTGASQSYNHQRSYSRYLKFLESCAPAAEVRSDAAESSVALPASLEPLTATASCDFYLHCNPPIRDHAQRGSDTPVERLNRILNLLIDSAVKKYGEKFHCPPHDAEQYNRDMDELRVVHMDYQQALAHQ
ncbi:F-box protein [Diplonema papillatum]|nr:F-box protein [Diplonema papillatum]